MLNTRQSINASVLFEAPCLLELKQIVSDDEHVRRGIDDADELAGLRVRQGGVAAPHGQQVFEALAA